MAGALFGLRYSVAPAKPCDCPPERQRQAKYEPKLAAGERGQGDSGYQRVCIYCHRIVKES
jgi:hypothetical protein